MNEQRLLVDSFEVLVVRSKRRSLGLELSPTGIKARAPHSASDQVIKDFVRLKQGWILRHMQSMPPAREPDSACLVKPDARIDLRGESYLLTIKEGTRDAIRIRGNQIIVPIINGSTPQQDRVKRKLIKWYKTAAQEEFRVRARHYATLMDVPLRRADQIYVRDYKRRWGSCDSKGKLSFNWRILQAPTPISDYVIVHELAHCHEFNHSKRFWHIVARQMPNYKEHEEWLRVNGHRLYRF